MSIIRTGSATELAVASSKAALASAGMDPALIDATFVGNVIQSRCVQHAIKHPCLLFEFKVGRINYRTALILRIICTLDDNVYTLMVQVCRAIPKLDWSTAKKLARRVVYPGNLP